MAQLAVPRLADWCSVMMAEGESRIRTLAIAHVDPEKVKWADDLSRRYPPDLNEPRGVAAVLRPAARRFIRRFPMRSW